MKRISFTIIILYTAVLAVLGQGSPSNLPAGISSTPQTVSPSAAQNYILTYSYLKPFTSHPTSLLTGDADPVVLYYDGLGRPIQSVSIKATQSGQDLLTYQNYDAYGRPDIAYLPFAKGSNNGTYLDKSSFISQQNAFLIGLYGSTDGSKGYAVTGYESSPLNRILKQGAPGAAWQTNAHPVGYAYKTNTLTIQSWKYSGDTYTSFYYSTGTLSLTETTDGDGKVVKEYTDNEGKVVQKETGGVQTRYCYDDFGLLRCVIQPMGSSPASSHYCFYYKYDKRKRLTDKLVPGSDWIYYIYDVRDRLVLSQDGNQRSNPTKWTYHVYDSFNRLEQTGTWATTTARSTLTTTMESAANLDYIRNATGKTPMKYLHYTNYTNLPAGNVYYTTDATALGVVQATINTGRLTWTETKALDYETDMDYWITAAFYFDKYERLIQTVADNHLNGKDYITYKYNFTGQITQTRYRHVAGGVTTYTDQYQDYDHRGRLMKIRYQINGGTELLLSANSYDEAGQLADKYLHSQSGSTFLQRMDYSYNIRGWLTQINDPATFSENDKFGLQLYYNTAPTGGTALYNGNISGMKWGAPTNSNMLYRFTYDNLNRLTVADFDKSGYTTGAFDCTYAHDLNGNFTQLTRKKLNGSYIENVSSFFYEYGNKLTYVNDNAGDDPLVVDYPGNLYGNDGFFHDENGNVRNEPYKGLGIEYNLLNLPNVITNNQHEHINYSYTFDGTKLRQSVEDNGILTKVDYCGPFVYETASGVRSLKYFLTTEGRAVKNGSSWDYEYNLKDHLGNTRAVIKNNGGVAQSIQERHYFPFGMEMSELSTGTGTNKYLYNGKEFQNDLGLGWYDYGARFYDPALGRWHSVDPLAEDYYDLSPYSYCAGNPVKYIDVKGEFIGTLIGSVVGAAAGAYDSYKKGGDVWAGAAEGAVSGAIAGAAVDLAVAATVATGGGALVVIGAGAAAGAIGGAAGAVAGDATGQVVESVNKGSSLSNAVSNISTANMADKAKTGAITGTIGGTVGAGVAKGLQAVTKATNAMQSTMAKSITEVSKALPAADGATINGVQKTIERGIEALGKSTSSAVTKTSVSTGMATESAIQVGQRIKEDKKP